MAKTNFQYEKRQKELEKKKKAEEKARRKLETKNNPKAADEAESELNVDADQADGADAATDAAHPVAGDTPA